MNPASRRGFTLAELLVALLLFGIVAAALTRLLIGGMRVTEAQGEWLRMDADLRSGAGLLAGELQQLGRDSSSADLLAIAPDSLRYRALRNLAVACAVDAHAVTLRMPSVSGVIGVGSYDSLLLFQDGDPANSTDDKWAAYGIDAVAGGACPDGAAGVSVALSAMGPAVPLDSVIAPAPVRAFEAMTLKVYTSDGRRWFGAASGTDGVQPVLGPLAWAGGTFSFRDSAGHAAATPGAVRSIEADLRAESSSPVAFTGQGARRLLRDSIHLQFGLRNAQ
jgi:prepilin-type N-terminal cleavage/methylation domain-containing protein